MPEEIDGRYLFEEATRKFYGKASKNDKVSLNNIVQIQTVREARSRNVLNAVRPFESFYEEGVIWKDGTREHFDVVIWCTGFKANLEHLNSLGIIENGKIETRNTRSVKEPGVWLVGYGSWTGFASATIYGVGKTARQTVDEIIEIINL